MKRVNWNIEKVRLFVENHSDCKLVTKQYKNQNTEMEFVCDCNKTFTTTWKQFYSETIKKRQCNECGYRNSNKDTRYNIPYVNKALKSSGSIVVNSEYKDIKTPITVKCECGEVFETIPDYIINGNRRLCFDCQPKYGNRFIKGQEPHNRKPLKVFLQELKQLRGEEYQLISGYRCVKSAITLKHKCGYEWVTTADGVLNANHECPMCYGTGNSKLTRKIESWLKNNGIQYEKEYVYDDCTHIKQLRFDYAIVEHAEVKMLIEADGEQHFKPSNLFGGDKELRLTQLRDEIKDNYCKENNIKLLRIPYFDIAKVDSILQKHI